MPRILPKKSIAARPSKKQGRSGISHEPPERLPKQQRYFFAKKTKLRLYCFEVENSTKKRKFDPLRDFKKTGVSFFRRKPVVFLKRQKYHSISIESLLVIPPFFARKVNLIPIEGDTSRGVPECGQRFEPPRGEGGSPTIGIKFTFLRKTNAKY